ASATEAISGGDQSAKISRWDCAGSREDLTCGSATRRPAREKAGVGWRRVWEERGEAGGGATTGRGHAGLLLRQIQRGPRLYVCSVLHAAQRHAGQEAAAFAMSQFLVGMNALVRSARRLCPGRNKLGCRRL